MIRHLTTGCSITVSGRPIAPPGRGQAVEIQAESVALLGPADPETYLIQKQATSLEPHYPPPADAHPHHAGGDGGAQCLGACRACFFAERGFVLVHTPIITASDREGASQFRVTWIWLPPRTQAGQLDLAADLWPRSAFDRLGSA